MRSFKGSRMENMQETGQRSPVLQQGQSGGNAVRQSLVHKKMEHRVMNAMNGIGEWYGPAVTDILCARISCLKTRVLRDEEKNCWLTPVIRNRSGNNREGAL